MEWLFIVFVVLVGFFLLAKLSATSAPEAAYVRRDPVFTPAERSFYGVLKQACGGQAEVLGKVRVADVVTPRKGMGRSKWQSAFNRIAAKHFDYLICHPGDLSVIAAVELNDASHKARSRSQRDAFLASVCESAGLALHYFDAKRGYSIGEVRGVLFPEPEPEPAPDLHAGTDPEPDGLPAVMIDPEPAPISESASSEPVCPKCGSTLVQKVARKGKHAGEQFLACSDFPACRYIRAIDA